MDLDQVWQKLRDTIVDNLPQEIGVALAALILAAIAAMPKLIGLLFRKNKLEQKPDKPEHLISEKSVLVDYINSLVNRGLTLSFGGPSSWMRSGGPGGSLVTLEQVWTPLRVADSQARKGKSGTHENMSETHNGIDLLHAFNGTQSHILILGDPGSGKSTSVAMLCVNAARERLLNGNKAPIPIWINLALVAPDPKEDHLNSLLRSVPELDVVSLKHGPNSVSSLVSELHKSVIEGTALLFLDGLDEVKEHNLEAVRKAINFIVNLRVKSRVVVTCRKFDYRQLTPSRKINIQQEFELLPYSHDEQVLYVERWYDASVGIGRFTESQAREMALSLTKELGNASLLELVESPLLLALLTLIHSEEAKLPDARAVVCDRAIKYMLADSAKWRSREPGAVTVATPPVISLAINLAKKLHEEEALLEFRRNSSLTVSMVEEAAMDICKSMEDADGSSMQLRYTDLSDRLFNSHGILQEISAGQFKFAHRSFQEFLAGQYFAAGAHDKEAMDKARSIHWREPFRLMASFSGHEGGNLYYVLSLIERLADEDLVSCRQLAAEMLAEIGRPRLALRQFKKYNDPGGLWEVLGRSMSNDCERIGLSLAERERSASVAATLGDLRFEEPQSWANWYSVQAGTHKIGTAKISNDEFNQIGGFVSATRVIDLPSYQIGRYPVTNREFKRFIEGDGYSNVDYWLSSIGRGWLTGERDVLEAIKAHWLSTVHEHHAKEIRDGEIDMRCIEQECDIRIAPRKEPYYWHDRRFNALNQPVVGINWWEASAYCEWATHYGRAKNLIRTDQVIRLATEFEWEAATREVADDRLYPWGDQWDEERGHVSGNPLNLMQPCPVGVYLEYWCNGPCDLAGNVWEWTASLHLPYDEDFDLARYNTESFDERVVRGSSWYNSSKLAACSARAIDRSYNLFYDVGFRVVLTDEKYGKLL